MEAFKKGSTCVIPSDDGLAVFGRVIDTDHDGTRLLIKTDDGRVYVKWASEVSSKPNDLVWKKIDEHQALLVNDWGFNVGEVTYYPSLFQWIFRFEVDDMKFSDARDNASSLEDAIQLAAQWINQECSRMVQKFEYIKNHLPQVGCD